MVPVIPPTYHAWSTAGFAVSICRRLLSLGLAGRMAPQTNLLLLRSAHMNVAWSGLYFRMGGLVWSIRVVV